VQRPTRSIKLQLKSQATPNSNENAPKMAERDRQCLEELRASDPWDDKRRIEVTKRGLL
jgi:hypothetical protein